MRVDGDEWFNSHPYNELKIWDYASIIKAEEDVPEREWLDDGTILYGDENLAAEEIGRLQAANDGLIDSYEIPSLIKKYMNQSIEASIADEEPVIRMFAILDRRLGKRRLKIIAEEVHAQPEWLQKFYSLRLDAEGIRFSNSTLPL